MTTAKQIIEGALRTIGVLASGEEGQPSELQDALFTLNGLLGDWSNDGLLITNMTMKEFDLQENKRVYTYGTGGDFNATRPMSIEFAQILEQGALYPCSKFGLVQYKELLNDSQQRPQGYYLETSYPLAKVYFPTYPTTDNKFSITVLEPFTKFANIVNEVNLPDGYDRALRLNLAVELAAEYNGKLTPETVALAEKAKMNIQNRNVRVDTLTFDFTGINQGYDIKQGPTQ